MQQTELTILVGELLGVPKVSISGTMLRSYEQAVSGILNAFKEQGTPTLILDLAGAGQGSMESMAFLLRTLRDLGPGMCVHVVAVNSVCCILRKTGLGPSVRTYCSIDEVSEKIEPEQEYLTSRWMAPGTEDTEIPLAA